MDSRRQMTMLILYASLSAAFLATSSVPTPLYATYRHDWGLNAADTASAFGVYALALLVSLLTLSRISDHVGRKRVVCAAVAVQLLSLAVFVLADGMTWLIAARVLQGLSTGAGISAVGARLVDIDIRRGTIANAAAPPLGSAVGAIAGGLFVAYLPWPKQAVYMAFAVVMVGELVALALVREPVVGRHPGALSSMRPVIRMSAGARPKLVIAIPVLFAIWATSGLFGSLGPQLVKQVSGSSSPVLGALPLAIIGALTPLVVFSSRSRSARESLGRGICGLVGGAVLVVVAALLGSLTMLLVAAAAAGVGFGLGFRGAMELVVPDAAPEDRAGTLAVLYIASYLGFGVPAIAAGVAVIVTGSLTGTLLVYAAVLVLLAVVAAAGLKGQKRTAAPAEQREGAAATHPREPMHSGQGT
ncbi:MAG: hypothetical protein QOH57_3690 [Mycobacterium sp.]|nr:hypothetical protein [Mycobacterium sp.]